MNGFEKACGVEAEGLARVYEFLKIRADDGRYVRIEKGRLAAQLQQEIGDILMNREGSLYSAEVKIEQRFTGNLFLETFSNAMPERLKPGWLYTNQADLLLYHFLDRPVSLFIASLPALKGWAFRRRGHNGCVGRLCGFEEKQQTKYDQLNVTVGRIVPIAILKKEAGMKELDMQTGLRPRCSATGSWRSGDRAPATGVSIRCRTSGTCGATPDPTVDAEAGGW